VTVQSLLQTLAGESTAAQHARLERAELAVDLLLAQAIADNERRLAASHTPLDAREAMTDFFLNELCRVRREAIAVVQTWLAEGSVH
jgi:hypothetical protein